MTTAIPCGNTEHHEPHYYDGDFCMGHTTLEGRVKDLEDLVEKLASWVHYERY